jgi:hypothetical protein
MVIALVVLAGCALPATSVADVYDPTTLEDPAPLDEGTDPTPVADESGLETEPDAAVEPDAEPSATPEPTPTPAPPTLEAYFTNTDPSGAWWWKKVTVTGEVHNPTSGTLSGVLTVTFTKAGAVVQTRGRAISNLAGGETVSFTYTSDKSADDAELRITTD